MYGSKSAMVSSDNVNRPPIATVTSNIGILKKTLIRVSNALNVVNLFAKGIDN